MQSIPEVAGIKWDWLNKQLQARKSEYSSKFPVSMYFVTWNVNGQSPGDLTGLFEFGGKEPEVVFVGLQELIKANDTVAMMFRDSVKPQVTGVLEEQWVDAVLKALCTSGRYSVLRTVRMAGIFLMVFTLEEAHVEIASVVTGEAGCGLMGIFGNKGGVGVRLRVYDHWLTVVNCHFAANEGNVQRRNQDFREIRMRLLLPNPVTVDSLSGSSERAFELLRASWGPSLGNGTAVDDCDEVIWMGDLNYRCSGTISEEGREFENDELTRERDARRVLPDFMEHPVLFKPTYKYIVGSGELDPSRKASYCDRILWRALPESHSIHVHSYDSIPIETSDHKPVYCRMTVDCLKVDRKLFDGVFDEIVRSLDVWENSLIPVTELASCVLEYGEVKFRRLVTKSVVFRNCGRTVAHYSFVSPPECKFKSWLRCTPSSGILLPGSTVEINVHLLVSSADAYRLNIGEDQINTLLVLHVAGGRDHFISVEGVFIPTLFARPLQLTYAPVKTNGVEFMVAQVPVPLKVLSEYIVKNKGLQQEGMFLVSGERSLVDLVIDCIDNHAEFPEECRFGMGMLAVGECLLRYLEALPEPVIPGVFTRKFILRKNPEHDLRELPEASFVVFEYVVSLVKNLPTYNPSVDADALGYVLGIALTRLGTLLPPNDEYLIDYIKSFILL